FDLLPRGHRDPRHAICLAARHACLARLRAAASGECRDAVQAGAEPGHGGDHDRDHPFGLARSRQARAQARDQARAKAGPQARGAPPTRGHAPRPGHSRDATRERNPGADAPKRATLPPPAPPKLAPAPAAATPETPDKPQGVLIERDADTPPGTTGALLTHPA